MKYLLIILILFINNANNKQPYHTFYYPVENTFEYSGTRKYCKNIKIFDSYGNEANRVNKCKYKYFPFKKGKIKLYVKNGSRIIDTIHGNVISIPDFKLYLVKHFTHKNNYKPSIVSGNLDKEAVKYELFDYEIRFKNRKPILYSDSLFKEYLFKSYANDTLTISKIYVKINNINDTINVDKKFTLRGIQDRH